MQRTDSRRILGTAALALSLLATGAVRPTFAQTTPPPAGAPRADVETEEEGEGFDSGLLGLLGLAGLLGLRRREATVTRVDATASTRPRV
jgi:hypothetical protein